MCKLPPPTPCQINPVGELINLRIPLPLEPEEAKVAVSAVRTLLSWEGRMGGLWGQVKDILDSLLLNWRFLGWAPKTGVQNESTSSCCPTNACARAHTRVPAPLSSVNIFQFISQPNS